MPRLLILLIFLFSFPRANAQTPTPSPATIAQRPDNVGDIAFNPYPPTHFDPRISDQLLAAVKDWPDWQPAQRQQLRPRLPDLQRE